MSSEITWRPARCIEGGEGQKAYVVRAARVRLEKGLSDMQIQASRAIAHAYEDLGQGYGYALLGVKTVTYASTGGSGGAPNEDFIDRMRKRLERLHTWEFACAEEGQVQWVDAVRALEGGLAEALTARAYAGRIGRSPATVLSWYRRGLDLYAHLFLGS